MQQKNKVQGKKRAATYSYDEEVREFTGLIFHCPTCDEVFHLHIAYVRIDSAEIHKTGER